MPRARGGLGGRGKEGPVRATESAAAAMFRTLNIDIT